MAWSVVSLLLAGVLGVSGAAKLLDPRGTSASLREFAVPTRFVAPLALVLPLVEVATAAALLVPSTARVGAAAAFALFAAITLTVGATLARGRRPECGCFGKLHSRPIGWTTLARTTGLAATAAVVAVVGVGDGVGALAAEPAAWLAAVTGGQSLLLVAVLRRHGRTLARLDELETAPEAVELARGAQAPDFALPDLSGEAVSLSSLIERGRPTLLVFGHPGCGPCTALVPELARWQQEHGSRITVALVTQGGAELNRAHAEEHGLELVLLEQEREVAAAYGARGTPAAVLLDTEGRIAESLRYGAEGAEELFSQALADGREPVKPVVLLAAAAATAAAATPALAAPVDDEDDAIRELKRILRAHDPALRREARRVAGATQKVFASPRSVAVKFELVSAIALAKKELRRTKEELDAVPVPDYRRGEKGARIGKSHATSALAYLDLALDRYAKATRSRDLAELRRFDTEIVRFVHEAEKSRRLAAKKLGCTRKLEEC